MKAFIIFAILVIAAIIVFQNRYVTFGAIFLGGLFWFKPDILDGALRAVNLA